MTDSTPLPPTVQIPLLPEGYTVVDEIDSDLSAFNWSVHDGYPKRNGYVDGKPIVILMHRVIMSRVLERPLLTSELVDHWDRVTTNNTRKNLRLATRAQNQQNRKVNYNNKSGYKGVSLVKDRSKWRAGININGKAKTLGYFDTPEMAAQAYNVAAQKHFGEFAHLNIIGQPAIPSDPPTPRIKVKSSSSKAKSSVKEVKVKQDRLPGVKKTTSYMGVRWDFPSQKWIAEIRAQGRDMCLGRFNDDKDAARAYNEATLKYFGDWAYLNRIED